jgi:hypothetical protein
MNAHIAEKDRGLEDRYRVAKVNDPTGKHDDCRYFVLDPQHDPFAVAALRAYAREAGGALAADITMWLHSLGYCPRCDQVAGHRGTCVFPPAENEHRWIAQDSQCWCGFRAKPFEERTRYEQHLDHLASVLPPAERSE